jgi:hypothetical protein
VFVLFSFDEDLVMLAQNTSPHNKNYYRTSLNICVDGVICIVDSFTHSLTVYARSELWVGIDD